jgi:hypothetical protein
MRLLGILVVSERSSALLRRRAPHVSFPGMDRYPTGCGANTRFEGLRIKKYDSGANRCSGRYSFVSLKLRAIARASGSQLSTMSRKRSNARSTTALSLECANFANARNTK